MNDSSAAQEIVTDTYVCTICTTEGLSARCDGLPIGWKKQKIRVPENLCWENAILCPDCIAFQGQRERTHDSSSAINDDPPTPAAPEISAFARITPPRERKWHITVLFHTDKGVVESGSTVIAPNPLAAIDELQVVWSRLHEMFSITVTPAPLEVN